VYISTPHNQADSHVVTGAVRPQHKAEIVYCGLKDNLTVEPMRLSTSIFTMFDLEPPNLSRGPNMAG